MNRARRITPVPMPREPGGQRFVGAVAATISAIGCWRLGVTTEITGMVWATWLLYMGLQKDIGPYVERVLERAKTPPQGVPIWVRDKQEGE